MAANVCNILPTFRRLPSNVRPLRAEQSFCRVVVRNHPLSRKRGVGFQLVATSQVRQVAGVPKHSDLEPNHSLVQTHGKFEADCSLSIQLCCSEQRQDSAVKNLALKLDRRFAIENPAFFQLLEQRITSYWNCYYRDVFPHLRDYPAFQIAESFKIEVG